MRGCPAGCCSHDPAFWQPLELTAKDAEDDDHTSPLAGLVQDYYGPRSMLSEVTDNIASVSSTSAPSAMTSGATSATALTGTSVSALAASAASSSSIKQRTMCFVLIALLARALHVMGLCTSLVQVAVLAGLGGGICQCISGVSAQAGPSSHELSLPSSKMAKTAHD